MSNMVVRTNVFALNAHRNLTNVGLQQRQAAQRLSSGYRINSAADDAAGLAISESMRAQIRGLDQASINAQDGVGLIQTAEGAMSTVSDMVIRIRELMVQAANDTNTLNNREMIQLEIDQIMTEINDVTFRTQFNTRTLLAGGLGGEGGGPSSPVSLQWMVFQQARVIGLSQPGGIVTTVPGTEGRNDTAGRLPNVHWNENNRTETSLRNDIVNLQNELNALARRVAERQAKDPNVAFTPDDLSAAFQDVRNYDFSGLELIPAERTELQSIANRIESLMRQGIRAAEDLYQITQDQINALGGRGAINFDGSRVFSGPAVETWEDSARAELEAIRNMFAIIEGTAGSLNAAMNSGVDVALTEMQTVLDTLVGQIGMATPTTIANPDYVPAFGGWEGPSGNHATQPTLANGDPNPAYTNTGDPFAAAVGTPTIPNPVATIPNPEHAQWLADNPTLDPADNPHAATIPNPDYVSGLAAAPLNTLLDHMEKLLDMSTDVLGNVNLESNAMWFQIGPNSLQGMVLQLKGIHTGILGGGRGDLAMLIDVRERSGIPISEQLEFIDLAEGIVNSQRAQLGAVQNRLEFTRQSLDISSENLSAAESRIRDTDMAKEMMRFTAAQVLQQAGISMLAQANQLPASILQLLQ